MADFSNSRHVNLSPAVGDIYEWCPNKSDSGVLFSRIQDTQPGLGSARGYFFYLGNNMWWSLELKQKGFISSDEVNRKMKKVFDPSLL